MKLCYLVVNSLLVLLACGSPTVVDIKQENKTSNITGHQQRIFGGSSASSGSWPYQGLYKTTRNVICGCSLISRRWALTAAHCTHNTDPSSMFLTFGTINRVTTSSRAQGFSVDKKIEHPNFSSTTLENDITLLFLSSEATEDDYVQRIALPPQGADVTVGKYCTITGWGTIEDGTNPAILQQASVPVISNSQCQSWLSITGARILDTFLCAGLEEGGVDTCLGDSGGPLACYNDESGKYYLQGITSFGYGCAEARRPGVYTRVSEYSDWITENTGIAAGSMIPVKSLYITVSLSLVGFLVGMTTLW